MSYEKQNFVDGQVLEAEHLNKMEDELARPKSWNELADKPFGDIKRVIVPQGDVQFAFNGDMGMYIASIEAASIISEGDVMEVVWDGTVYSSQTLDDGIGNIYFGNLSPLGMSDTGEPFLGMYAANMIMVADMVATENITHNISVSAATAEVIAEKYLPFVNTTYYIDGVFGGYVYSDEGCTVKVAAGDVITALRKGLVSLFMRGLSYRLVPLSVGIQESSNARVFLCFDVTGKEIHYYTAEYTGS